MTPNKKASIPKAVGPYRHAVAANGLVFVSGQIPANPATGELVTGDIRAATRQVLENLSAVLASVGLEPDDVVKTTIFLSDLRDFTAVNEVYAAFFSDPYPARACIQVAALPKGAAIEIEAIAINRSGIPHE